MYMNNKMIKPKLIRNPKHLTVVKNLSARNVAIKDFVLFNRKIQKNSSIIIVEGKMKWFLKLAKVTEFFLYHWGKKLSEKKKYSTYFTSVKC